MSIPIEVIAPQNEGSDYIAEIDKAKPAVFSSAGFCVGQKAPAD